MNAAPTKSLTPRIELVPEVSTPHMPSFDLHYHSERKVHRALVINLNDPNGLYGSHGRELVSYEVGGYVDLYA